MDIVGALQHPNANARLTVGYRWLTWDNGMDEWVVSQHKYGEHKTRTLYRGLDQDKAVEWLTEKCDLLGSDASEENE
jgi:hypothetical protein